ncbi:hypothetical protein KSF73_08760 [Burkholderiaceae bacterium DAT-1]|nr:hypothetical protein [Burkholderiaceae bacterium DAT-1]
MYFNRPSELSRLSPWFYLLVFLLFAVPGMIGREPWKPDEAYTLGLVKHMVDTGDWVVPTLAGEPFMEKPPIFFMLAAAFAKCLGSSALSLVDAARFASLVSLALAAWGCARVARQVGASSEIAVIGMLLAGGLIINAHLLITDLALLAGTSLALAGLTDRQFRKRSAALLGVGAGIAFLSKGLLGPGVLAITVLCLIALDPDWRSRRAVNYLMLAALFGAPLFIIWPCALWLRSPELFHQWFWVNNFGRFTGAQHLGPKPEKGGYWAILAWAALPAWPLALIAAIRGRIWANAEVRPVWLYLIVTFAVLSVAADGRMLYATPMFLPIAVLAGLNPVTPGKRTGAWVMLAVLLLLNGLLWYSVLHLHGAIATEVKGPFERMVVTMRPADHPVWQTWRAVSAGVVSIGLIVWFARDRSLGRLAFMRAWLAGMVGIWMSFAMLLLPWLAVGNDYKGMMLDVGRVLREAHATCLASERIGEPQRALLDYYIGVLPQRLEVGRGQSCDWRIIQYETPDRGKDVLPGFDRIWTGSRVGDQKEWFVLWRRQALNAPVSPK